MSSYTIHSHTIHFKKSHKDSGFTLIELLVVISIIALLSTIVLAVVQDARVKAKNTAKNSLVLEYVKALELYRSDNESYPETGSDVYICFGYSSSESCFGDSFNGSDSIKSSMEKYLPDNFADRKPITSEAGNLVGVYYTYPNIDNGYTLTWALEKNGKCIDKSTQTENFFGNTLCEFKLK